MGPAAIRVLFGIVTALAPLAQPAAIPPDTRIQLERKACYGNCPVYTVAIDAAGRVTFTGTRFVQPMGTATAQIAPDQVRALLEAADRIGFFGLDASYRTVRNADGSTTFVTDLPTTIVTITRNGQTKRVEDYYGAPAALHDFEKQIDETAGTRRWIGPEPAANR